MKKIIWLASYPKSGNTWFRIFLCNLLSGAESPISINEIQTNSIASSRKIFDQELGIKSSFLTFQEIDALRPEVYQRISDQTDEYFYKKIHDAYTLLKDGRPLVPMDATFKVLYFVRNPLDVCISFSHHNSAEIDKTIENMNDSNFCFSRDLTSCPNQLRQKLLKWSTHVTSWLQSPLEVLCIRYEDMKLKPTETFEKAVTFLELSKDKNTIQKAIENSQIDKLKQQEQDNGFREKPLGMESFFRKGEVGSWKEILTHAQIEAIVNNHYDVMQQFGYIDSNGQPT